MLRVVSLLILAISITGCASNEIVYTPPYCHTDQTIVKQDDTEVSSQTVVQCTDRPGKQAEIQRAGIDKGCTEFWYHEKRNGKLVPVRGVLCENASGTGYEILNINGYVN